MIWFEVFSPIKTGVQVSVGRDLFCTLIELEREIRHESHDHLCHKAFGYHFTF